MAFNLITLQTPTPDQVPQQAELNEALVRELLNRTKGAGVALLGAVLLLWMIVRSSTGGFVFALFLALVGCTLIRLVGSIWIERRASERFHHMRVFTWFAAMTVLIGLGLGAIIMASYPHLPPLGVAMCTVCIIAINSGAMVGLAGSPLVYLLYVGSNMAALTFVAFAHPLQHLEHTFQAMQIVASVAQIVMMRSVHSSLRNNILLRLQLASGLVELRYTQVKLVEASRQAGRSDVTTELLHSIGNVLNSVNVSATLVTDILARSKTNNLSKVVAMIMEHRDDFGRFFREDARGQKLPDYFTQLVEVVERDNRAAKAELQSLTRNVDHIKLIVASRQAHVMPSDVVETFDVHDLIDDALQVNAAAYDKQAIEVVRRFDELPPASLDRHKVLQILSVLVANARDAVMTNNLGERRIVVHARRGANGDLELVVEDNGCGIDPQNLDQIFGLGFTTKAGSHGSGLHYSACAARELKGNLTAHSAGVGSGAWFLLSLPL